MVSVILIFLITHNTTITRRNRFGLKCSQSDSVAGPNVAGSPIAGSTVAAPSSRRSPPPRCAPQRRAAGPAAAGSTAARSVARSRRPRTLEALTSQASSGRRRLCSAPPVDPRARPQCAFACVAEKGRGGRRRSRMLFSSVTFRTRGRTSHKLQ